MKQTNKQNTENKNNKTNPTQPNQIETPSQSLLSHHIHASGSGSASKWVIETLEKNKQWQEVGNAVGGWKRFYFFL